MTFHGRRRELRDLGAAWRGRVSSFIPVYGRRRVGKSELIVRFMEGKGGLYLVGKQTGGHAQIREFMELAARLLDEPLLASASVSGWKTAFETVMVRWKRPGRLIIALDEFQWMVEACPELPSVIQELWDRTWSKSGRVMLILCGSYLGFMERDVLGRQSPLFGRRTGQILLRPFNHLESAEFHPRYSITDQARVYGICGGVPMYLAAFDDGLSVEQNIMARFLEESSPLAREPEFLLREELRDLATYQMILLTLAHGKAGPTGVAEAIGEDARKLNYYIQNLVELGYVQRRHPLTGSTPSPRHGCYALDDPLLRFWFRFVLPHSSLVRSLGPQRGFAEVIRPGLDAYLGHCFERLCREALPMLYAREGVRAPFRVGEYWDREVQIDVVGVREDQWTDLGECKWGGVPSLPAVVAELEKKVARYPNIRNATLGRRLFVRAMKSRPKPAAQLRIHTLEDLYRLRDDGF